MFRAIRVDEPADNQPNVFIVEDLTLDALMAGDVTVDIEYSGINYKDGMALGGRPGIIREYPLIPGIDLVGIVSSSEHPGWQAGDRVLVNGYGLGETHHGGLAEKARVPGDWLVRVPDAISNRRAAAIGTAGLTAMLSILALEELNVLPEPGSTTDVLVTGASGGVGSIAIALLAHRGNEVTASTGRRHEAEYLLGLGATTIIGRDELNRPGKPLGGERWAAAIDVVGGVTLANVLAQINRGGAVATCGLVESTALPTTVLPFILRGVTLTGINSVYASHEVRVDAWDRLARYLDLGLLDSMTSEITLGEVEDFAPRILAGEVRGRTVVNVRR
ncbi:MAG: oxidoreductase [Cryobacterium sp.]|nr:oxidoreductase [Cryobacterium sp.]